MTVIPFLQPGCPPHDQEPSFIAFLYFVMANPDTMEIALKELGIQGALTKADIPRFADWVAINLWGTTDDPIIEVTLH